jgi:hypothetical protein
MKSARGSFWPLARNPYGFSAGQVLPSTYSNSDGGTPLAGLVLSGNTLHEAASQGDSASAGTVFSLSFQPQPTITPLGTNIILSWPTNVAGFDYTGFTSQSTTNLASPAAWANFSPGGVVVNGQNVVTNPPLAHKCFSDRVSNNLASPTFTAGHMKTIMLPKHIRRFTPNSFLNSWRLQTFRVYFQIRQKMRLREFGRAWLN